MSRPDLVPPAPARYYGRGQECDRCGWREEGHPALYVVDEAKALRWCAGCCRAANVPLPPRDADVSRR